MGKKVELPFFRTPYNYDTDAASDASGLKCEDPSLAKQSFAEECDINTIVKRFGIDYVPPEGVRAPMYGDFTEITDFRGALEAVESARASFMAMPARVRAEFENDPGRFVEFCSDERNAARMVELGLAVIDKSTVPPTPAPTPSPAPSPAPTPAPAPKPA